MGFFLNPTNKGPKGIADMGCESLLASSSHKSLHAETPVTNVSMKPTQ